MNNKNIIWQDFIFFFNLLKSLRVSENISLGEKGGFCVSTNTSYENWVYYPEKVNDSEIVKTVINFFNKPDVSFMWPLYDGGNEILESSGLLYAGDLTAMSYEPENINVTKKSDINFERVLTREHAEIFSLSEIIGFGGEPEDLNENVINLFDVMKDDKNISLFVANYKGNHAGTFAITHEKNLTGVYYLCVEPKFRRMGIAREIMNEICRLSDGKTIVLQATPMGAKFYENFGFTELFKMPVYSNTSSIF